MSRGSSFFATCTKSFCWLGPRCLTEAEAAEAWNTLMRGRVPDAPKEGAVRIPVYAYADGRQIIRMQYSPKRGWYDLVESEKFPGGAPFAIITADLPLPKPVEVVGRVEP